MNLMKNKKDPLITVIVPIYNVETYLSRCLKSISTQTYTNIEIILVNDGSTDHSLRIAQKWAANDNRIILIDQSNKGLSEARNTGIKNSSGEYLTFIDSDDYITPDYIEYLYGLLKRDNFRSKLSICSLMNVFPETEHQENMGNGKELILTGRQCIQKMCYHDLVDTCAYAKLGKRDLYTDNFFPKGKLFEDIGSTYKLFEQCDRVACGFVPKYYYVIRKGSIVTGSFNKRKLELLEMTDKMANDVNSKYPELKHATLRRQVYARFSTLNQTLGERSLRSTQRDLINFINLHKSEVLNDPLSPKRDRIAYKLLSLGLPLYKFAWGSYLKIKK